MLAEAFPARSFSLPGGGHVAAMEIPDDSFGGRCAVMIGVASDGYPIAMWPAVPEGRRLSAAFVAESISSDHLRNAWNESFSDVLSDFEQHLFRRMGSHRRIGALTDWIEARFPDAEAADAAFRHVFENPTLIAGADFLRGRQAPHGNGWSPDCARRWHRLHGAGGPDGPGTWIRSLCFELPGFADRIMAAARLRECPLRQDLSSEHNVLIAVGILAPDEPPTPRLEKLVRTVAACEEPDQSSILQLLAACPDDWRPKNPQAWYAARRIAAMASALHGVTRLPIRQLVSPCKGRWEWWCDVLARIDPNFRTDEAGGTSKVDLEAGAENVDDVLAAFFAQVIYPALRLADPTPRADAVADYVRTFDRLRGEAASVLFGEASAAGILEASIKWHLNRPQMEAELAAMSPEFSRARSWEAGLPPHAVELKDGRRFEIVPLTSQAMLADEGRRGPDASGMEGLDHCVGTLHYVASCLAGRCRIVSLREVLPDGSRIRHSTAEFRYSPRDMSDGVDRGELMMVQHRGRANATPPDQVKEVLRRYHRAIAGVLDGGPHLAIDHGAFVRIEEPTSVGTVAGYDAERPELVEGALRLWEPFLRRPLRGLDLETFMAASEMGPTSPDTAAFTSLGRPT